MALHICPSRVREVFDYDASTGNLYWKVSLSKRAVVGAVAGCYHKAKGYTLVRLDNRLLRAHRVVWVWVHGENPPEDIDHINGIRDDNRLSNLRLATRSQNLANKSSQRGSSSRFKGVSLDKRTGKWDARIGYGVGKNLHLGLFNVEEEAALAYNRAAYLLHGEFAKLNTGVGLEEKL
jgi:hypothetical protein